MRRAQPLSRPRSRDGPAPVMIVDSERRVTLPGANAHSKNAPRAASATRLGIAALPPSKGV